MSRFKVVVREYVPDDELWFVESGKTVEIRKGGDVGEIIVRKSKIVAVKNLAQPQSTKQESR